MVDPWGSVAEMLRWKLDGMRKRVDAAMELLPAMRSAYDLPKSASPTPDNWSYGQHSPAEVAEAHYIEGLRSVREWMQKADAAIEAGDLPTAVHFTMQASDSLWSTGALRTGVDVVRLHGYIAKQRAKRKAHAIKGNKARAKYSAAERARWQELWKQLHALNPALSRSDAARQIARRQRLPTSAESSIRHELEPLP